MNRPARRCALSALALALCLSVVACGDDADDDAAPTSSSGGATSSAPVDDDVPLTGDALERASQAALAEVGEGQVTDSGRSDDADHVYEVEVTLPDGQDVDVELDGDFRVTQVDR